MNGKALKTVTLDQLESKLATAQDPTLMKGKKDSRTEAIQTRVNIYIAHTKRGYSKEHIANAMGTSVTQITYAIKSVEEAKKMHSMFKAQGLSF